MPADPLTPRQREVARLFAAGYSDRQIADEFFFSVHTVGVHVRNILQRRELRSRYQVATWLAEREACDISPTDRTPRPPR